MQGSILTGLMLALTRQPAQAQNAGIDAELAALTTRQDTLSEAQAEDIHAWLGKRAQEDWHPGFMQ